ncbi:NAD-dependent epimerase/dehydratase family protein [Ruminococcus sp. AF13-28]|nr:NAD-dependent epimerase/dehydratase family protein [Ruminococcus sp. AF13-37]RGW24548.1 NAD-dependent epimerase/dehydratase family protein [Ruminococcus sp. AF13-28]
MKKVLIFGVGGFVGSYLSNEFLENGYKVIGSDKVRGNMLPNAVEFYNADLLDGISVERLINFLQPDIVINLAAISSVGQSWKMPQATISVNVLGALNIMEAARKTIKKPKIMFIGSSEEYVASDKPINEEKELDATNPYGISKVTQEQFAKMYRKQYGLKIYCVRPFNHTGIGQKDTFVLSSFCKQVAEIEKSGQSGIIKVGNLSVKRDFSHVKDIVRAYRMIIESDDYDTIYNVGSGIEYSLDEILKYIIDLSSQKIRVEIDEERCRPSDQLVICCDHKLITEKLGWKPKYTVFDALKEMYQKYLEE